MLIGFLENISVSCGIIYRKNKNTIYMKEDLINERMMVLSELPLRSEIDESFKWKLEDMYKDDEAWEKDFNNIKQKLDSVDAFRGKINTSATLVDILKLRDEISKVVDGLFAYARMRRDEDNANSKYQALTDRAMRLAVEVSSRLSYIEPEILSLPKDDIQQLLKENQDLRIYLQYISDLLRMKPHILDAKGEHILASAGEMAEAASDIFQMLDNADIRFGKIKDEKGQEVELTKGRYIGFMESQNREVRKAAFDALYDRYKELINTFSSSFVANIKKNIFYKNQRNFSSSLEASLFSDNIPQEVYDNLIEAVHQRLDLMHRYVRLRKKVLGLDELHMYDLYVPLVKDYNQQISYDDAQNMVIQGLSPMGEEYIGLLKKGLSSGWVDVYENRGKTGGAYSWGTYGNHPYVLLNFQGKLNDVFTLAHEMGHALHTHYSHKAQPYIYSNYAIFVAEVASTCNEALLINHMLKNAKDKKEKLFLLNYFMEQFRGTIYRQTMFAEFEKIAHELLEKGEPLHAELLGKIYHELNEKYYGKDIIVDERIDYEWARIPHFYSSFYVYKYATGFSAAIAISQKILKEGPLAVAKYKEFLSGGSSDYPLELLKRVDVDMTQPKPVIDALGVFEGLLDQYEDIINHG